jgi:hypothetical protein
VLFGSGITVAVTLRAAARGVIAWGIALAPVASRFRAAPFVGAGPAVVLWGANRIEGIKYLPDLYPGVSLFPYRSETVFYFHRSSRHRFK